ncbi:O-antigen ligase family protein [Polynucleobacter necessarius]|uniref:O-antigen ligase family protein n=1 Tax=Polynucleobacter necessarius TaxID=576610 RepID=UPI0038CD253A
MVIATIYPICFIRLNEKASFSRAALVISLWICLVFSLSRTGILSCFLLTFLILLSWPQRFLVGVLVLGLLALLRLCILQGQANVFVGLSWLPYLNQGNLEGSSLVRGAHILASCKAWLANPFFGVGLGQLGYVLPVLPCLVYASFPGIQSVGSKSSLWWSAQPSIFA